LWANRVTPNSSISNSLFFLVYGKEETFPTHTFFPSLQLAQSIQDEACPVMKQRLDILLKLGEERENSKRNLTQQQQVIKKWFDNSYLGNKYF
jgi:hypothetical protein